MISAEILVQLQSEWKLGTSKASGYNLSTDNRKITSENLFLCLKGDRFDAFDYLEKIAECKSVESIIFTDGPGRRERVEKLLVKYPELEFIAVKDSLAALQELAILRRSQWQDRGGLVFSLTGSNGKTTTKEIMTHFLVTLFPKDTLATIGNLNNHIGVPLTLLRLEDHHKVAVVEMGTNHPGEIERLCEIANPQYGLITNVGHAHVEYLGGLEGVYKEKSALFRSIKNLDQDKKSFVVNADDDFLKDIPELPWAHRCHFVENTKNYFKFSADGELFKLEAPHIFERHNRSNMMLAFSLVNSAFPGNTQKLVAATESFVLPKNNRSQLFNVDNSLIYLDAYNANPSSMKASLESFKERTDELSLSPETILLVLGDMNEIGDESEVHHRQIARLAGELGFRHLVAIGRFAHYYLQDFKGSSRSFATTAAAKNELSSEFKNYRATFIKGSRSLQLESLLDIN